MNKQEMITRIVEGIADDLIDAIMTGRYEEVYGFVRDEESPALRAMDEQALADEYPEYIPDDWEIE